MYRRLNRMATRIQLDLPGLSPTWFGDREHPADVGTPTAPTSKCELAGFNLPPQRIPIYANPSPPAPILALSLASAAAHLPGVEGRSRNIVEPVKAIDL